MGQEPGAADNRLSLSLEDFPQISKWKDGTTYSLSDLGDVQLTQISPGEFEVSIASPTGGEGADDKGEAEPEMKGPAYRNPAVRKMAQEV